MPRGQERRVPAVSATHTMRELLETSRMAYYALLLVREIAAIRDAGPAEWAGWTEMAQEICADEQKGGGNGEL